MITASTVLAYFDPEKETRIQVDASKNGLETALMRCGKPVTFVSKDRNLTQRPMPRLRSNYFQSSWAVKTFMNTSMAERWSQTTRSYHKKATCFSSLLKWFQKYVIIAIYRPGKEISVDDALSYSHMKILIT